MSVDAALAFQLDNAPGLFASEDFREGARRYDDPQAWADHLVETALLRGSRDNATCIVVFFDPA